MKKPTSLVPVFCALAALLAGDVSAQVGETTTIAPVLRLVAPATPIASHGYADVISRLGSDLFIFANGTMSYRQEYHEAFASADFRQTAPNIVPDLQHQLTQYRIGPSLTCRLTRSIAGLPYGLAPTADTAVELYWYGNNRNSTQSLSWNPALPACPQALVDLLSDGVLGAVQAAGQSNPFRLVQSFHSTPSRTGMALSGTVTCPTHVAASGEVKLYSGPRYSCDEAGVCTTNAAATELASGFLDGDGRFTFIIPARPAPSDHRVLYVDVFWNTTGCTSASGAFAEFAVDSEALWAREFEVRLNNGFIKTGN